MRMSSKVITLLITILFGCDTEKRTIKQFTSLKPEQTKLFFQNNLTEGPNTNVLMYEYFYNGGGVAIADFNGDEKLDIYLTSNMEENKMFLNRGDLKFEDISNPSKVQGRKGPWKTGVTAVDINGDGRMDLYVCYSGKVKEKSRRNQLFLNMGNNEEGVPLFTEVARLYGLDSPGYSNQGYFFDYDRDGDLDMLLLNHNPNSLPVLGVPKTKVLLKEDQPLTGLRLFEQHERYFKDITTQTSINGSGLSYGLGIALSDFNNDGWTDFYVSNDYTIPDYLYINDKNGDFENKLSESIQHTSHFSMGNDSGDINNDGWVDLLTLDMLPEDNKRQKLLQAPDNYNLFELNLKSGFHYQYMRNMLQLNNGNGTFSEVGQQMGISNTDWSWSALFADFNNDSWQDLFISNGYKRDYTNRDFLSYMENFIGEKKSSLKREDVLEIINNMPASNVSNYIYSNENGKKFKNVTKNWGLQEFINSNGAAYGDLDNDGDLDLVVNNINTPVSLYRNNSNDSNNFIQIQFEGLKNNRQSLGTKARVFANGFEQVKEQFPTRGYLSTVSPILHFGLGKIEKIDSIQIQWPNGSHTTKKNIPLNQKINLKQEKINEQTDHNIISNTWFKEQENKITYGHKVKNILDFDRQKLLHFQPSFEGPPLTKGDLNQDGKEDIVIGGGKNQPIEVWLQNKEGSYSQKKSSDFIKSKNTIVSDLALSDLDSDGDLDLYVGNGGYHNLKNGSNSLIDQVYMNNGKGFFMLSSKKNTPLKEGTSVVAIKESKSDGNTSIFLGGSIIPGSYPKHYSNKLIICDSKGNLTVDEQQSKTLNSIKGIVRDAIWTDINQDGSHDLILVGEWMPVTVFLDKNGVLEKQTNYFLDSNTSEGWWNTISSTDLNNDGKIDFVIGNEGINNPFNPSSKQPIQIHYDDFDDNGSVDPIISYYIQGKAYPLASRDELLAQLVQLKSVYPSYKSYAEADLEMLLRKIQTNKTKNWKASQLESIVILSSKDGYLVKQLPDIAQRSPLTAIHSFDINADGNQDLLLFGNRSKNALKLGSNDANYGTVLLGKGDGSFDLISPIETGLNIKGDVSDVIQIGTTLYIARSNNKLSVYKLNTREN